MPVVSIVVKALILSPEVVVVAVAVKVVIVAIVVAILHHHTARPGIFVVGIAAANVDVLIARIDTRLKGEKIKRLHMLIFLVTYDQRHPQHLQLGGQIERLFGDESLEVASIPRNAQHGRRTHHERLRGSRLHVSVIVALLLFLE